MLSRLHTLHSKETNRSGGLQRLLLDPLNEHPDEPAIKRVEEILSMLVAADAHLREQVRRLHEWPEGAGPEFLDNHEKMKDSERAYYQTLELLNIKLSRYRWEATLSGDIDGFRSKIAPAYRKDKWGYSGRGARFDYTELWRYSEYTESFLAQRDKLLTRVEEPQAGWQVMESFMIARLLDAVNEGEISRFRRCAVCRRWFYASRGHQQFCGAACRRSHEAQNPAFKEKRRRYMRERYRPLQKELEQRSVKNAKTAKQKKG